MQINITVPHQTLLLNNDEKMSTQQYSETRSQNSLKSLQEERNLRKASKQRMSFDVDVHKFKIEESNTT